MSIVEIKYLLINAYQKDPMSPLSTFVVLAPESFFLNTYFFWTIRRRDTRFLENEKLTLANQNEIKFKSQGKFFKTHTKSVYIIYSWSNAEKAVHQFYQNKKLF